MTGHRFNDPVFRQLFQKLRCSGRFDLDFSHHIRTSKDLLTGECLTELQNMVYRFRLEYWLNVRFQAFNVRFFRFFPCTADMQCPIMERMVLIQKKIS